MPLSIVTSNRVGFTLSTNCQNCQYPKQAHCLILVGDYLRRLEEEGRQAAATRLHTLVETQQGAAAHRLTAAS